MYRLIEEIRAALRANMFTLALQGTLALVDICAALGSDSGRTNRSLFEAWFQKNLGGKYPLLGADDVYQLRCGMLHQGRMSSKQYEAIIFTLPHPSETVLHNNRFNDALNLDLVEFCDDIITAAELWWAANRTADPVLSNSADLARIRPGGLEPYVVGLPVLA